MIPNYQELMRPVLKFAQDGEVSIRDAVEVISNDLNLSEDERTLMLPSGKQTRIANRIHWARSYLKQAGLVRNSKRGFYVLTQRGIAALNDTTSVINNAYLAQFDEYQEFKSRTKVDNTNDSDLGHSDEDQTPDENLRTAFERINASLAAELLSQLRGVDPYFFETVIVDLFIAMGYGADAADAGRAIGQSGDNGVDGVIDQDPLGVDQIYLQAKRYAEGNNIGSGAIRDFFGALSIRRATKGIFVTTSHFSAAAKETAANLGSRIVLIDGRQLANLMIKHNVGCRDVDVLRVRKIDEGYFSQD